LLVAAGISTAHHLLMVVLPGSLLRHLVVE
jgi:hypothetical protein